MARIRWNWGFLVAMFIATLAAAQATAAEPKTKPAAKPAAKPTWNLSPGEQGQVSLFGIQAAGSKFVYVLDRSGSMGDSHGEALAAAKRELASSLDQLDSVQQFQIIFYNEVARKFNPTGQAGRLAFGTSQNKIEAKKFIDSIEADGGSAHEDALVMAIRLQPDVIFFLTDADDPKLTSRDLARIERLGAGTIINTVEFGSGPQRESENFLVKLSRQSGGQHTYVDVTKLPQGAPKGK